MNWSKWPFQVYGFDFLSAVPLASTQRGFCGESSTGMKLLFNYHHDHWDEGTPSRRREDFAFITLHFFLVVIIYYCFIFCAPPHTVPSRLPLLIIGPRVREGKREKRGKHRARRMR